MNARARRRLERTAYHEAGHAVMGYLRGRHARVASIRPDEVEGALGHVLPPRWPRGFRPDIETGRAVRNTLEGAIVCCLAGGVAQALFQGHRRGLGTGADFRTAVDYASYLCGDGDAISAYLAWLWYVARDELQDPLAWPAVEAVAAALLVHERLGGREVRRVIKQARAEYRAAWHARYPVTFRDPADPSPPP